MKLGIKLLGICALGGAVLTGCTKNYYDDGDRTRIRLSSHVELAGLNALALQDLQIEEGRSLSFFVTSADNIDEVLYENQTITADGRGGFTYSIPMYYPDGDNPVDFYAVHPYAAGRTLSEPIDFVVPSDQSTDEGYLNADLLYATRMNVTKTVSAVAMEFSHKLSRIDFVIQGTTGIDLTGLNRVQVLTLLPEVSMSTSSGVLSVATGTATAITAHGVLPASVAAGPVSGISAIVVPQSFTGDGTTALFRIRIGETDYDYIPASGVNYTFNSGEKITFTLTIHPATITVTSTVAPWTDGGSVNGDANVGQ